MFTSGNADKLFIGGRWTAPKSSATLDVISPWSEQIVANVPEASGDDVDLAVAAARKAFDAGPWPRMDIEDRIAIMRRFGEAFERHADRLAKVITEEMGSPITQSHTIQARVPQVMLRTFIELAESYPLRMVRQSSSGNGIVFREPKGVVAAIVPWNAPIMTSMMKLAPALLMGCCVILKASTETALSGYVLAEMLDEAGVPEGVVSILATGRETSEYLALHPGVDKVSFTGSTAAGMHLASRCGEMIRSITLELGGKSAAIVLDDAELSTAVAALRMGSLRNSGQICTLKTRIVVSRRREKELLERLVELVKSMPVGDPHDPITEIGPLASLRQRERVARYIDVGIAERARLVHGGPGRPHGLNQGWFVQPTIFANVDPRSTIAQEEIFGPVLSVIAYDTEDEAIAIANNSNYGLNGSIFTADIARGLALARRVKSGVVEVNGNGVGFTSPFGGVKRSGIGREAGIEGFDSFTELKSIGVPKAYADALAAE